MPDSQQLSQQLEDFRTDIEEAMREQSKNITSILEALKGNPISGGGIISELSELKSHRSVDSLRISKLEKFKSAAVWFLKGMVVPSAYGLWELFRQYVINR